jgi:endonuclease/exonuclease/phosphatase family metal-dependent hydrolase
MLKIVTYNIQYARGRDGRYDLERTVAALHGADIIGLQEVDRFWDRTGNIDQATAIAERLQGYWWVYGPGLDVLKQLEPGPQGAVRRQFGNMVLARFPILSSRNVILPRLSIQGISTIQRAALETVVELPGGRRIRVTCTHFCHLSSVVRVQQAQALLAMHQRGPLEGGVEHGEADDPVWLEAIPAPQPPADNILLGDFNMEPSSPEYAVLAGEPHPRRGRLPRLDAFADAWLAAGHLEEEGHSFYSNWPDRSGKRLDYGFVSAGLAPLVRTARVDTEIDASDHQPLWLELDL